MNTFLAAGIIALVSQSAGGDPAFEKPISLNFSQTEVSQVFRAIGMRTGTNIIYSATGPEKVTVTMHFNASSADEAVRGTAAAAGLAYRRVGRIYVVAKPEALRQALAPFATRDRIKTSGATADLAKNVQDLLPMATVVAGEGEIVVVGIPDDVRLAREIIDDRIAESGKDPRRAEVVTLGITSPAKVAALLSDLYPTVKVSALTDLPGGGGSIALLGRPVDIAAAKAKALEIDSAIPSQSPDTVVQVYDVLHASVRTVIEFLIQAAPSVQALLAPPSYLPEWPSSDAKDSGAAQASEGGNSGGTNENATGPAASRTNAAPLGPPGVAAVKSGPGSDNGVIGSPNAGSSQYDRSTRILLKGRRADVEAALAMLRSVDQKPRQVRVDVRIVDASPQDLEKFGLSYEFNSVSFVESPRGTSLFNIGKILRTPLGFNAALDFMVKNTSAKLLANPSIQVIDNQPAQFFVGDKLNFALPTSGPLGSQNTEIKEFSVGIELNVRPRVSPDGTITLSLNPIVQTLTAISGAGLPQVSSREAKTTVMVKDGETLILGGLIRDEDIKTVQSIPLLSRLPLVGQLFRHTDRDHRRSNVVVTVTPHIIVDPAVPK